MVSKKINAKSEPRTVKTRKKDDNGEPRFDAIDT